jgi:hypothetical protein
MTISRDPDLYRISGQVLEDVSSLPVPGLLVKAYDKDLLNDDLLGEAMTASDGTFKIEFEEAKYKERVEQFLNEGPDIYCRLYRQGTPVMIVYDRGAWDPTGRLFKTTIFAPVGSASGSGGSGGGGGNSTNGNNQDALVDLVSDIAAYMPTSQEVGGPVGRPRTSGTGAPAALQELVDRELMAVLGGRVKTLEDSKPDPKSFLTSLTRAFQYEELDGQTRYKHVPRAYAVQTELGGAITGAQASLYRRARVALDDALPLLAGLAPLDPASDNEETAAVRAIVRTEFVELVNELGREGGPRVQRVDDIFVMLKKHIKALEERFGLDPNRIVTVEEEQDLTNFEVIRDYVSGLDATWRENRTKFTGNGSRYLGTQLVRLARALNSVAESVEETYRVMDAVLLGPSERQTVEINFPAQIQIDGRTEYLLTDDKGRPIRDAQGNLVEPPSMVVEELLSWVERFATEEGPTLIREGGRRGVQAIEPVAVRLALLVKAASQISIRHIAFTRTRVRRALSELADQLKEVADLAQQVADTPPA